MADSRARWNKDKQETDIKLKNNDTLELNIKGIINMKGDDEED